jgi:hypothetical protein
MNRSGILENKGILSAGRYKGSSSEICGHDGQTLSENRNGVASIHLAIFFSKMNFDPITEHGKDRKTDR